MAKTETNIRNRPGVMPAPKPAPNFRTNEGDQHGEKESTEDAEPPVAEGQAVEPVDAAAGTQSTGTGGGGNRP